MVRCAIQNSKNYHDKKGSQVGLSFFTFPKQVDLRITWIIACRREDKFNPDSTRVCSDHFDLNDYVRDLRSELMCVVCRRQLIAEASPHVNLSLENPISTIRNERLATRNLKRKIMAYGSS